MSEERYVLATGEEGEERLAVVNEVHGPDTRAFLLRAGLKPGMRVADIGCGIGTISCWMAGQVGADGTVQSVDVSAEQIATARRRADAAGIENVTFAVASAYDTQLEAEGFDLVFCRFVLMHLQRPEEALREMRRLLRPGGVLAVEDGDFTALFCHPPLDAFDRCMALYRAAGERHGADFEIGRKLYALVRAVGFEATEVAMAQPVFVRGQAKRLPEWTLAESANLLIEAGLTTAAEIDALIAALSAFAARDETVIGMARMMQVAATK
jgi:SAM-dependent methyltransferase